ncbi:MAG: hypothetical protein ABI639_09020 [Thermoanaerobaculia bacterium]
MSSSRRSVAFRVPSRIAVMAMAVFSPLLLAGIEPAQAGVSLNVLPAFPATVTAAETGLSASISFSNSSTGPDAAFSMSITAVALTPSCGNASNICNELDPGVFALSATGTGQAGSACAGATFAIGPPDVGGASVFTPSPAVVLAPSGQPGSSCTVSFTFAVLKVPTIDASNPTPGVQTDVLAQVSGATIGNPGSTNSSGSIAVTVLRAQPTLATTASAAVTLGGQVSDMAQLSSGSHPGGASVTFHLYGPNDASCILPQVFVSTNPAGANGSASSNAFAPVLPGIYRWIAAYGGDANNLPVQAACNDALESVVVSLAPQSIAVAPGSLASNVPAGGSQTLPLEIQNQGAVDLVWSIGEAAGTLSGSAQRPRRSAAFSNGELVSRPGAGIGGADVSVLDRARGLTLQGFGIQLAEENRLADDFTVPGPAAWTIDTVTFYSYQTSSTTTLAVTDLRVQIWDGPPDAEASRIVFGDRDTNRLLSSTFSNVYRVSDSDLEGETRPVMANVARIGATLRPGTYWLDWSAGDTSGSGPWSPPIAFAGRLRRGNALQATAGEPFTPALDGAVQMEFPFRVSATFSACDTPSNLPWLAVDPTIGITAGGATTIVSVALDASGLAPGSYSGVLCVHSNDPDTPVVEVPVTFVVAVLFLDGFEGGSAANWSSVFP